MATWTTPVDRSTGYVVTANDWNQTGQDDLTFLYGDAAWTLVVGGIGFQNSWGQWVEPVAYRKVGTSVSLRGGCNSGTAATAAFTLPAGYRPVQAYKFACATDTNNNTNIVIVGTDGTVKPTGSTPTYMDLIQFDTI